MELEYDRGVRTTLVVLCALACGASAQPISDADRLFDEGIALFEAGKFDEACAKFELSIAKDPRALGTLMNLGRCNERRGKVATALKIYREAYDRASEANATGTRDKAQERIAALVSQTPTVVIKRAGPPLEGEKLVVADRVVALSPQGTPTAELLLDPGAHNLVLTAPGRLPYETTITLPASTATTVLLPVLELPQQTTTIVERVPSSRRLLGKVVTFGGLGLVLTAGVLARYAKHDYGTLFDDPDGNGDGVAHCGVFPDIDGKPTCDASGQSDADRDRTIGSVATVVGVVGVVSAATGIVLWLTAPRREVTTVVPTGTATSVGVVLVGRF